MSPITIHESGLAFGPFHEDECFHVEKSALYAGVGEGVKTVEFMLVRHGSGGGVDLLCVEAKNSSPRAESREDFAAYFAEIRDKMLATLLLFLGARLGRHGTAGNEIPPALQALPLESMSIRFLLVVTTAQDDWLPPLQDQFRTVMLPIMRAFKVEPKSAAVLNPRMARGYALIP